MVSNFDVHINGNAMGNRKKLNVLFEVGLLLWPGDNDDDTIKVLTNSQTPNTNNFHSSVSLILPKL